jgi:hypothetical protein
MIQLMSYDEDVMPDALAGLAALSAYLIFHLKQSLKLELVVLMENHHQSKPCTISIIRYRYDD